MMKMACIVASGFEDSELRIPYERFTGAGIKIDVVGEKRGDELVGERGKERVKVERSIDEVDPNEYEALFIPGGYSPDKLRADDRFVSFVRAFDESGKIIAAVCHGPQLLLSAGLVRGRTMTAWKTVQEDLRQAGADVVDSDVVVDRNLVTSRQPSDLEAFSRATLRQLGLRPGQHLSETSAQL